MILELTLSCPDYIDRDMLEDILCVLLPKHGYPEVSIDSMFTLNNLSYMLGRSVTSTYKYIQNSDDIFAVLIQGNIYIHPLCIVNNFKIRKYTNVFKDGRPHKHIH